MKFKNSRWLASKLPRRFRVLFEGLVLSLQLEVLSVFDRAEFAHYETVVEFVYLRI